MAWTSGFFNSINNDRLYTADQMSAIFNGLITDGVYQSVGNKLAVQPNNGMTIQINTGRGWFGGKWADNDSPYLITLEDSDVTLNRYAAICVRADINDNSRKAEPYVKYSDFATNPVKPTMVRNELVKEFCLAYVLIRAGASSITAADIEDTRANTEVCGWVTGLIEQLDSKTLWEQWEAEFNLWFDTMKDQLTEDAAGNLQIQINDINTVIGNLQIQINSDFMPKTGGKFTGDVSHKASFNEYFETLNGYKFRVGTGTTDDTVYLQAVDSTNKWIADIIKFNATTGKITGGQLMPIAGGTFTGMVTLKSDPTANLHSATKQYVDNGIKLLWTNASPTSAFVEQTLNLNLSGYKFVDIVFYENKAENLYVNDLFVARIAVGTQAKVQKIQDYWVNARLVEVKTNTIRFEGGYWYDIPAKVSHLDNKYNIPYKIYGVR